MEELKILEKMPHYVPVSGMLEWNFEELYETMWDYLDFIRVRIIYQLLTARFIKFISNPKISRYYTVYISRGKITQFLKHKFPIF